jgi:hypothetical protein
MAEAVTCRSRLLQAQQKNLIDPGGAPRVGIAGKLASIVSMASRRRMRTDAEAHAAES